MTVTIRVDMGTLARVGTALADPTRRRVLVHLIDGPGYPAEMAEEFGTSRANLSNHLTCLRECGLVTAGDLGNSPDPVAEIPQLVERSASCCRG